MGVLSFLIIFVSGAIFGTAALVIGLIFVFNVGADALDKQREKAVEKRKKYSHLDAKKWLPKPRTVQVVATAAARTRARAASVSVASSTSSTTSTAQPALLLRKLVIELLETSSFPVGSGSTIDAAVRIRLGEQKTKSRSLPKSSGLAKWDQTFVLRVENAMTEKLELTLLDESTELATCSVSLQELLRDQPKEIKMPWLVKSKSGDTSPRGDPVGEVKLNLTMLDWDNDVPLTKADVKKTNSTKLAKDTLAESAEDRGDGSNEKDASDSAGIDDSLEFSTAASEDASEDPSNNSPPVSPMRRSPSAPLGMSSSQAEAEIARLGVELPPKPSDQGSQRTSLSSPGIVSPTPRRGSVSGQAAMPILSNNGSVAPMYKVLRVVGKKGAVKEVGLQSWINAKFLKKSKNYEKYWFVLDGQEIRVYETAETSTFLGAFPLEKAKVHKSRTKRHHMTIEFNKAVWIDHVHKLEDSPNAALMARHPAINAAQAAGISIKEPPLIAMKSPDDSISPWVDQCKISCSLSTEDLKRWQESGGDISTTEDISDMAASDDESSLTAATTSEDAPSESSSTAGGLSSPSMGLGDAVASISVSDKKTKKSRRTLSKDNDDKKRSLLGSAGSSLTESTKRFSLPSGVSLKVLDDSVVPTGSLKESASASSLKKSRAASVSVPLEVPLRASSPELPILSERKEDSTSAKRSSLLASSRSNNVVPTPSSSSTSASTEVDEELEIDYVTKEIDQEFRAKVEGEVPPLLRIPASVDPVQAAFLNAVLRRVFLDMRTCALFTAEVRRKIEKKFREIKRPPFLGPLELTELNWGQSPPQFDELKVFQPEKSNLVLIEADVRYEGGVNATLQTTVYINFPRPMSAVIPIKAFVTVSSLRGKLHLYMPHEANDRFELCLVESPVVDMNVHVDFGKGTRVSSLPKLKKFLFSAARKAIDHLLVYPSKLTFFFPLPGRKPDPEVVTPKDSASARNPTQGTTGSKGHALGSSPDSDDANACKFIALEFLDTVLNGGNIAVAEQLVAEDAILYGGQVIDTPWQGRDAIITWVKLIRHAFPDLFFYVEDCLMNGSTVTIRWIARGTFRGALWDYPPTGDEHVLRGIFMFKVKEGNQKIAELYSFWSLGTVYGLV